MKPGALFLGLIGILLCTCDTWAQTGFLYQSRIPFYVNLIPFLGNKDSIPNMVSVDYQYHQGICTLQNGKVITGWFKFDPYESRFNFFKGTRLKRHDEMLHKNQPDANPDTVEFDEVGRLVLAGKDSTVFTAVDSTVFIFSKKMDKLLRLRAEKPVRFYDDRLIVDELAQRKLSFWTSATHLNSTYSPMGGTMITSASRSYKKAKAVWEWVDADIYRQLRSTDEIFYEWEDKLIRIKKWSDASERFPIDPYILKAAEVLRKNRPQDIAFGILFSFTENKIALLPFFREVELFLEDGRTMPGLGFVQPYRVNGFEETGYLHFFDGKNFSLFGPEEIKGIRMKDRSYKPVFDNFNKRYYLGYHWQYEGEEYRIVDGTYIEEKPGFFNQGGEPRFQILRRKNNGHYVVEENKALRRSFISEKRVPELAE